MLYHDRTDGYGLENETQTETCRDVAKFVNRNREHHDYPETKHRD